MEYNLVDGGKAIWCASCHKTSYNANDVRERYCGHCQKWHDTGFTAAEQAALLEQLELPIWTIYERPADYPHGFVARAYSGRTAALVEGVAPETADTLEALREQVQARSRYLLTRMPRDPNDAASVVESWL